MPFYVAPEQVMKDRADFASKNVARGRPLTQVFTHEMKPLEVEILVAEVGLTREGDQLFHIIYDGTVQDEDRFSVLGGESEAIRGRMETAYSEGWGLGAALKAAVAAL